MTEVSLEFNATLEHKRIEQLTEKDVAAAKAKRGALSTTDYVLAQVGGSRTLEQAKVYLLSILEKKPRT